MLKLSSTKFPATTDILSLKILHGSLDDLYHLHQGRALHLGTYFFYLSPTMDERQRDELQILIASEELLYIRLDIYKNFRLLQTEDHANHIHYIVIEIEERSSRCRAIAASRISPNIDLESG